jgi:hypothetical protein
MAGEYCNLNFTDIPGQFGTQLYTGALNQKTYFRTLITAGACSDTSNALEISIIDPTYALQSLDLALVNQNINWDYNMGYRFRPVQDGQITELGGRWTDGVSHTVRLYDFSTGNVLASTTVMGSVSWKYNSIVPVNVTSGTDYVVAVRLNNQNSGLYSNASLPTNSGNLEIVNTLYRASSDLIPNTAVTNRMYG